MWNVLIPNIGRREYLVDYLKRTKSFHGKVFVSDCDETASGLYGVNDGAFILPKPVKDEKKYIEALINTCNNNGIKLVIPVIDPEIYILSNYRDLLQEHNILALVSERDVLDICYNKIKMNKFLEENNFLVPRTYLSLEAFTSDYSIGQIAFPVICKPIYGSGSQETIIVKTIKHLEAIFHDGLMIQEYLDAIEYGIDIFNNFQKEPVRCVIKRKLAMRSGETDKSLTVKNKDISELMIRLAKILGHIGNLDCDLFMTCDGKCYIIDLNPRFGGGYPATHEAGVNLLELIIDMVENKPISQDFCNYQENLLVMKTVGIAKTIWNGGL